MKSDNVARGQGSAASVSQVTQDIEKSWIPLESNPAILNLYMSTLGVDISKYSFFDVLSTEDWALDMIPQPVCAVVALFPVGGKVMKRRTKIHRQRLEKYVEGGIDCKIDDNGMESNCNHAGSVWYAKQRIRNACGTFG